MAKRNTKKKTLRVAFIGSGGIAGAHMRYLSKMDDVEMVAVADIVVGDLEPVDVTRPDAVLAEALNAEVADDDVFDEGILGSLNQDSFGVSRARYDHGGLSIDDVGDQVEGLLHEDRCCATVHRHVGSRIDQNATAGRRCVHSLLDRVAGVDGDGVVVIAVPAAG